MIVQNSQSCPNSKWADIFILYSNFLPSFSVEMEKLANFVIFKIVRNLNAFRFIITTNSHLCVAKDLKVKIQFEAFKIL